jgi:predicted dehydrogenase
VTGPDAEPRATGTSQVRLGIVGAGRFTQRWHLPKLAPVAGARVVAIAEPDPARIGAVTQEFGLTGTRGYRDLAAMCDAERLDGVIVATPHALHADQVRQALDRGLHVLVDKPVATDPADVARLCVLARRRGLLLQVGYQRHVTPAYWACRRLVEDGALGEIRMCSMALGHGWVERYHGGWRQRKESRGGVLFDSGRHAVDAVLWVSDLRASSVVAMLDDAGREFEVGGSVVLRFAGGATGTVTVHGEVPGSHWQEELVVWGRTAGVRVRDDELTVLPAGGEAYRPALPVPPAASPEENFCRAIRGQQPPLFGAEHDLAVGTILAAALRSTEAGRRVDLV